MRATKIIAPVMIRRGKRTMRFMLKFQKEPGAPDGAHGAIFGPGVCNLSKRGVKHKPAAAWNAGPGR